jgi:alkyl hydroperoxide reductase subunit AhpC
VSGQAVNFPMISDPDRKVSTLYGMIHPDADPSVTVRSVFVIDPAKKVRMMMVYPPSAGRSFPEILRVIDSLQLTDANKVATPVNWKPGEKAIILASMSDADAKTRFPQGWDAKTPYLRYVDLDKTAS